MEGDMGEKKLFICKVLKKPVYLYADGNDIVEGDDDVGQ